MQSYTTTQLTQLRTETAFTLINNVRDHCKQTDAKMWLMLVLAIYCNRDGVCWPSNETLMRKMRKGKRMIQRMLAELKADGEITILTTGAGRDKKRKISLSRYTKECQNPHLKVNSASSPLNVTRSLGETGQNNHSSNNHSLFTRETRANALRAASTPLSVSNYDFEEREKLKLYREILSDKDPQWLPINKYSGRVSEALELLSVGAMKMLCEAAAWLIANERDEANLHCKANNEDFDCYLPKPNLMTGKLTLVRLIQCNRDNLPEGYDPIPDCSDTIPT